MTHFPHIESELIQCSNGQVVVDAEDAPLLTRYSWNISRGYALTSFYYNEKRHYVSMHRLIMGMSNCHVDHANGDTLDNRKCNLRLCTRSQNMQNTRRKAMTGFRGVTLNNYNLGPERRKSYAARIRVNGERIHLGSYSSVEDAARVYDAAAKKYFGEFARLNFPEPPPPINIKPTAEPDTAETLLREFVEMYDGKPINPITRDIYDRAKALLEGK